MGDIAEDIIGQVYECEYCGAVISAISGCEPDCETRTTKILKATPECVYCGLAITADHDPYCDDDIFGPVQLIFCPILH